MIKSNLTEQYQKVYLSYLTDRYKQKWTLARAGKRFIPVISLDAIEQLFGINLPQNEIDNRKLAFGTLDEQYNIAKTVFNIEQLKVIAYRYKLTSRKSYVDLLVAHELLRYDNYLTDVLVLLLEDMYNAVQIHKEFTEAISNYSKENGNLTDDTISVDIQVNPNHGICYKELMNYTHYNGVKPQILFTIKKEDYSRSCIIDVDDYEMEFNEKNYNIAIRNIKFL